MLTWPRFRLESFPLFIGDASGEVFQQEYLRDLDGFANHIAHRLTASTDPRRAKLRTICFGNATANDCVFSSEDIPMDHGFDRAFYAVKLSMGPVPRSPMAVRTDRSTMRYWEPMLNLALGDRFDGEDVGMCSGGMGQFDALRG